MTASLRKPGQGTILPPIACSARERGWDAMGPQADVRSDPQGTTIFRASRM